MTGVAARRRWRRAGLLLVVATFSVLVLGTAGPASAHATLIRTDPVEGAVLESAPDEIRLTFDEAVAEVPDGVQVFDAEGGPVTSSADVTGAQLTVALTEQVEAGTLVVVWRVLSEDGHPVTGSLTFSVGAASERVEVPETSSTGSTRAPVVLSLDRGVGYAALFLATGLVGFVVLFLPAGGLADRTRRRLVVVARAGAVGTAVAWFVGLPLAAVYQLGGGAGSLTEASTWTSLPTEGYVITAVVVAGVALSIGLLGGGLPTGLRRSAALAAATAAVVAPAFTGHTRAASPEALVVGADMLHLLAGTIWLGGLVGLVLTLRDLADREAAAEVLSRFSLVGAGVLVALVATGSLLTWRIVGSWSALVDTGYGRLLLIKVAVVLVAVGIAVWNRYRLLPALRGASRRPDRRAGADLLVRSVAVEGVVLLVVLLLTGFLVDRSPGAEAAAVERARNGVQTATLGDTDLTVRLEPLTAGPNTLTLEMRDAAGEPVEGVEAPRAGLSSAQVDLGPVELTNIGPGTYTADVVLPSPGVWSVQVSLRISEFENPVTTVELDVDAP